jgi:glucose dehydrogenase
VWKGDRSEPTTLRQLPGGVSTPSTTPGFTSVTPHDEWDYDGINEMILADINVGGQARKVLVHFDRNGFGYTLDRTNGELLVAEKFDPKVNWATKVDMHSGSSTRRCCTSIRSGIARHSARPEESR